MRYQIETADGANFHVVDTHTDSEMCVVTEHPDTLLSARERAQEIADALNMARLRLVRRRGRRGPGAGPDGRLI